VRRVYGTALVTDFESDSYRQQFYKAKCQKWGDFVRQAHRSKQPYSTPVITSFKWG